MTIAEEIDDMFLGDAEVSLYIYSFAEFLHMHIIKNVLSGCLLTNPKSDYDIKISLFVLKIMIF